MMSSLCRTDVSAQASTQESESDDGVACSRRYVDRPGVAAFPCLRLPTPTATRTARGRSLPGRIGRVPWLRTPRDVK